MFEGEQLVHELCRSGRNDELCCLKRQGDESVQESNSYMNTRKTKSAKRSDNVQVRQCAL